jgi:hypothetical protein
VVRSGGSVAVAAGPDGVVTLTQRGEIGAGIEAITAASIKALFQIPSGFESGHLAAESWNFRL